MTSEYNAGRFLIHEKHLTLLFSIVSEFSPRLFLLSFLLLRLLLSVCLSFENATNLKMAGRKFEMHFSNAEINRLPLICAKSLINFSSRFLPPVFSASFLPSCLSFSALFQLKNISGRERGKVFQLLYPPFSHPLRFLFTFWNAHRGWSHQSPASTSSPSLSD